MPVDIRNFLCLYTPGTFGYLLDSYLVPLPAAGTSAASPPTSLSRTSKTSSTPLARSPRSVWSAARCVHTRVRSYAHTPVHTSVLISVHPSPPRPDVRLRHFHHALGGGEGGGRERPGGDPRAAVQDDVGEAAAAAGGGRGRGCGSGIRGGPGAVLPAARDPRREHDASARHPAAGVDQTVGALYEPQCELSVRNFEVMNFEVHFMGIVWNSIN